MEIADKNAERSTIIIAVMTLVTIGLSLILSTSQALHQQEDAGKQYLAMTGQSVLQAVESSLRRGLFVRPNGPGLFSVGTASFFRELENSGDVLFVGIIDKNGSRVLSSHNTQQAGNLSFPNEALHILATEGVWHGETGFSNRLAYVYAKRIMTPSPVSGEATGLPTFLVVGLDMSKHIAVYNSFKRNALFQAAYILGAAAFIWTLSVSFLKRREQAGRAAVLERFQARLVDNLPDGLLTLSRDDTISAANPAAHMVLRVQHGGLAGMTISALPATVAECIDTASRESQRCSTHDTWKNLTVDGSYLEMLTLPIREGDASHDRLVILRDRTQIRELEKNLSEAEKLAALGTLAAGVAHEIRNPLSALRGFAQYFAKKLAGKQPDEMYAQTMVRESDRLNRVITDLLYLSRSRTIEARDVNLVYLSTDVENLVRFDLESRNIVFFSSLGVEWVWADEDALRQAVLNLVLNSIDALDSSSKRTAETSSLAHTGDGQGIPVATSSYAREIHFSSSAVDNGTWIFVHDTGSGMSQLECEQAFEPFFTTKKKGTGLGLALVHKTMREHDGRAQIESHAGQGTTVSLFFPKHEV